MVWIQITSAIIGSLILAGTIIIVIKTRKATEKIDVTPNLPIVENPCRREFTEGYYLGLLTKQSPRKNGCTLVEIVPIDLDQAKNKPKPQIQSMIVKNEFIKRFAQGDLSERRDYVILIGRSPADYPEKMRDIKSVWMKKEGQLAHIKSVFGEGIKAGDEAIAEAMIEYARGNISKSALAQIKEINRKYREMQTKQPEESEHK